MILESSQQCCTLSSHISKHDWITKMNELDQLQPYYTKNLAKPCFIDQSEMYSLMLHTVNIVLTMISHAKCVGKGKECKNVLVVPAIILKPFWIQCLFSIRLAHTV